MLSVRMLATTASDRAVGILNTSSSSIFTPMNTRMRETHPEIDEAVNHAHEQKVHAPKPQDCQHLRGEDDEGVGGDGKSWSSIRLRALYIQLCPLLPWVHVLTL